MRGLQMLISNIFAVPKQFLIAFQIWSFELLSPLHELKGHKGCVRCSVFSMDSTLLATGDDNGEIRVGRGWHESAALPAAWASPPHHSGDFC